MGAVLAGLLLGAPATASAQVLEIDQAGIVKTYDRPTAFRADGSASPVSLDGAATFAAAPSARPSAVQNTMITRAADQADLSPDFVEAVAWQESRLHPRLVSTAGAIGEMQLMPATARSLGVDPFDSEQNFRGGARYLKALMHRYHGDIVLTLAAYDAGPGAVAKYGGVPPFKETHIYIGAVLDRMSQRAALSTSSRAGR